MPNAAASATQRQPIGEVRRRYRIHVDSDRQYNWIQLVSGLHVSGVNAALEALSPVIGMCSLA